MIILHAHKLKLILYVCRYELLIKSIPKMINFEYRDIVHKKKK